MTNLQQPTVQLNNGIRMPQIGFGVWKVGDDEVEKAIESALEVGYRSIDTAAVYGNESGVGRAIQASDLKRDDLFITTKVWNTDQGYDSTLRAFETSREKLGLEVIDLYLVHWAVTGKYKDTWRALEKLYKDGAVRAIGVCNFQTHHLDDLMADCEIAPMINQVEFHPLLSQKPLLNYCREHHIQLEAWSPLMQGNLNHPVLQELAAKYNKTPAQIVLRWDIQLGVVTIPKSVTPSRMRENIDIFNFTLSDEDMARIDDINEDNRLGGNPDRVNW